MRGTSENKRLNGTEDNDFLFGRGGDDTLLGFGGKDLIFGNAGNDSIEGGNGKDLIFGNKGRDRLFGDDGEDRLFGNEGSDFIRGGDGDDKLFGGIGHQFWETQRKEWMVEYGFYNEETGLGIFSLNKMDEIDRQLYLAEESFSSSRRPLLWHILFVRDWEREQQWQEAEQYCRQFEQYYNKVHHTGFTEKQIARYEYYRSIVDNIWDVIDARYRAGIHRKFDYEDAYEQWQWGSYFNTDASKLETIAMFAVETDLTTMGCYIEEPFPKYMTDNYWHFKEIGNWLKEIES